MVPAQDGMRQPSPEIFDIRTDKIWGHGYYPHYLRIAADLGPAARVLELGVDQGRSLRLWQVLFPMGDVAGVDNYQDAKWPEGTTRIYSRQDAPELAELSGPRDLIVDDGSHDGPITRNSLNVLWPVLAPGGYYVIEDWWVWRQPGSMLDMARDLPELIFGHHLADHLERCDVEDITFRWGMIVLRKTKKVMVR